MSNAADEIYQSSTLIPLDSLVNPNTRARARRTHSPSERAFAQATGKGRRKNLQSTAICHQCSQQSAFFRSVICIQKIIMRTTWIRNLFDVISFDVYTVEAIWPNHSQEFYEVIRPNKGHMTSWYDKNSEILRRERPINFLFARIDIIFMFLKKCSAPKWRKYLS